MNTTPMRPVHARRSTRQLDRRAYAHDASHYLLVPESVVIADGVAQVADALRAAARTGTPVTFRSGGTSLSGQGVTSHVLVDTRKHFRGIEVLDDGARVRVEPGATVRQVNARLARHGRKLGPDPASEIACTIGGVVANNSSGMACGTAQNSYETVESMRVLLTSGVVIDTGSPDADEQLAALAPELADGLTALRGRVVSNEESVAEISRQYSMKNTMGYGLNSLVDFERPIDILTHLMIGSEGTLGFVADVTFNTVPLLSFAATGLLTFPTLAAATAALPVLVGLGFATVELMDARSLRVAQQLDDCPADIAAIVVDQHCSLLVEAQAESADELRRLVTKVGPTLADLVGVPVQLTTDAAARAALWHVRKSLYPAIAGARRSGTTALLEDIAVPVSQLSSTCEKLSVLLHAHGYDDSVVFGHARDGNVHFLVVEDFRLGSGVERYQRFTEDLVELVLSQGGSLKAEHGTGRVMAPFVRAQFGGELYAVMKALKRLFDPDALLNPGVLLSDEQDSYLRDLKIAPTVETEVDRCVECGYCEPTCPSRNITLTPRQRIVLRRELQSARERGEHELVEQLEQDYEYDGTQTCAVDGMCAIACPVNINTGDLVRRLRRETQPQLARSASVSAAQHWGVLTKAAGSALTVANALPTPVVAASTDLGRALIGSEVVPRYSRDLPRGGRQVRPTPSAAPEAVYFPACVNTMFGPVDGSAGVRDAFTELCDRAGVPIVVPDEAGSLCCGTPWKSKGFTAGYDTISEITLPSLLEASDGGRLPIVCDAASCTEGLETMRDSASRLGGPYEALAFVDSAEFAATSLLPELTVTRPVESVVVHHTCSTAARGADWSLTAIARFVSDDVAVPVDAGCCAFAGDRGMLRPELTAAATAPEAAEVAEREYAAYVSANRTCEIGMTRATNRPYQHVLEVLEQATRVR